MAGSLAGDRRSTGVGRPGRRCAVALFASGLRLVLWGAGIGLLGAYDVSKMIESIAPGMPGGNFLVMGEVMCILMGVTALACYLPARKATKIDPVIALRDD